MLSIIIINYNTPKLTLNCIKSIRKFTKNLKYEIVLLDNASNDDSVEILQKYIEKKDIKNINLVISKKNLGFARGNNKAVEYSSGQNLLFLNSDTLLKSNILIDMVKELQNTKNVGILTCMLKNMDGSIQENGGYFPNLLRVFTWLTIQDLPLVDSIIKPFHPHKEKSFSKNDSFFSTKRELDWCKGAFMLMSNKLYRKISGFDVEYKMYTEDVDICFRIRKLGFRIIYDPKWSIIHLGGSSSAISYQILMEFEGIKKFYKKHYSKWHYLFLKIFIKLGSFMRTIAFSLLGNKRMANIYIKSLLYA